MKVFNEYPEENPIIPMYYCCAALIRCLYQVPNCFGYFLLVHFLPTNVEHSKPLSFIKIGQGLDNGKTIFEHKLKFTKLSLISE